MILFILVAGSLFSLIAVESVQAQENPKFGYETKGDLTSSIINRVTGTRYTCPESGFGISITAYLIKGGGVTGYVKCALYDASLNLVANGVTEEKYYGTDPFDDWVTFNFPTGPSLSAADYIIVAWADGGFSICRDTDTDDRWWESHTYNGFPASLDASDRTGKASIYCTYSTEEAPPTKPVLVSPENNHSTSDNTPTFTWAAGSGATSHRLVIDNDQNFADGENIYDNANLGGGATTCMIENELPPDNYWWKVCATNAEGDNWSENIWTFEITAIANPPEKPVLVSPDNNHSTSDNTPTFTWIGGSYADNHRIEVDNDPDFSSVIDNVVVDTTDNSWAKSSPGYAVDNYWWRVWAVNPQGENCSENTWTFEITEAPQPPSKPELIKPVENQPRFEWTTAEYADNYRLLVDNDLDFSTPVENRILIENYYQIPVENSLEDGVYWWMVIAQNEIGENASDVWTFSVGGVKAGPPIDLVAAAMFLLPIVLMGIALAFDNPVFAGLSGVVFLISGIYFIDTLWLMMVFIGLGIYLMVTAFMGGED